MSTDNVAPDNEPVEQTAELGMNSDSDVIEHGEFDDASDDFAYESSSDLEDEAVSSELESDGTDFEVIDESESEAGDGFAATDEPVAASHARPKKERTKSKGEVQLAHFEPQRLAKILAAAGIDARRKCEEFVTAGRVTVDGEVITDLAFRADPYSQKIELDGERIKLQKKVYFVLNKPPGVVCSNHDPAGRPRVIDLFPQFKERLFTIGRLDEESEGLLLVTNDGELANRMAHPRYRVPKFYLVHVKGIPSAETLATLKRGMYFEEGKFKVEGIRMKKAVGNSSYLDIVLNEGQNREIRRLLARVDHKVMKLKRVGFGPIRLGNLASGAFRPLTSEESKLLQELSAQRAHLDSDTSRGRRKSRGAKSGFGSKSQFGEQRYGTRSKFGGQSRSRFPAPGNEDFVDFTSDEFSEETRTNGGARRRPSSGRTQGPRRSGGDASERGGARRPAGGERIPRRRFTNATEESFEATAEPGNRRGFTEQRRFGNRRPGGYSQQPPRGDRSGGRTRRRFQSDDANGAFETQTDNETDFNGGRRRFRQESTEGAGATSRRPARGPRRPAQRRFQRDARQDGEGTGDSSQQRRFGGNRRFGQTADQRGRGQRAARPPRPLTADGKEILEGKVTGYRTIPKEGLGRRRRTAIQGMQINRKQRQQRRKKADDE